MKTVVSVVGGIIAVLALIFLLNLFGFMNFQFFAPKVEAVRRATYEQSQAYNEGMVRDLENLKMEYESADDMHKAGLRSVIMHRFSSYHGQLPSDLQSFYFQLKGN